RQHFVRNRFFVCGIGYGDIIASNAQQDLSSFDSIAEPGADRDDAARRKGYDRNTSRDIGSDRARDHQLRGSRMLDSLYEWKLLRMIHRKKRDVNIRNNLWIRRRRFCSQVRLYLVASGNCEEPGTYQEDKRRVFHIEFASLTDKCM